LLAEIYVFVSGSPTKVLGDDITTKKFEFKHNPQFFLNVFVSDFLNAIFGRPIKMKILIKMQKSLSRKYLTSTAMTEEIVCLCSYTLQLAVVRFT